MCTFICVSHIPYVTQCTYFNIERHFIISLNNIQTPTKNKIFLFFLLYVKRSLRIDSKYKIEKLGTNLLNPLLNAQNVT